MKETVYAANETECDALFGRLRAGSSASPRTGAPCGRRMRDGAGHLAPGHGYPRRGKDLFSLVLVQSQREAAPSLRSEVEYVVLVTVLGEGCLDPARDTRWCRLLRSAS